MTRKRRPTTRIYGVLSLVAAGVAVAVVVG